MGNISPNPFLKDMDDILQKEILELFMKGIKEDGLDFRGCLFIGLMIEDGKAKVLEYNVRFGDPETQVIMLRLDSDLYDIMEACATNNLKNVSVKWKDEMAFCLVLASGGYPGSYPKGLEITGIDDVNDDIVVFHAGTALKNDKLVTNGGRVLNVCTLGTSIEDVRERVYKAAEVIQFEGKYYRKDIGLI
jgi:phosphoribosylamine--glycine ligase